MVYIATKKAIKFWCIIIFFGKYSDHRLSIPNGKKKFHNGNFTQEKIYKRSQKNSAHSKYF